MPPDTAQTGNPACDAFAGDAPAQVAKRLFHATRPKFFPASLLPVLAGSAWGFRESGGFDAAVFLVALLATLCLHAAANVLNDVGDDSGGTDRINEDRVYPYTGGSRFIQTGIMSAASMARLGITLLAVAALAGLYLLVARGPTILAFGLCGVALGVLYSLGPVRLSRLGIGELAVALAFGVLPVAGAAWLQSGTIDARLLVFSVPISAWVANILLINGVPDIGPDERTGKRTLPVRLGLRGTAAVYLGVHLTAVAAVAWLTFAGALPLAAPLVPAILLLPALKACASIRQGIADRAGMRRGIEATLAIHMLGSLWLCAVVLYAALAGPA